MNPRRHRGQMGFRLVNTHLVNCISMGFSFLSPVRAVLPKTIKHRDTTKKTLSSVPKSMSPKVPIRVFGLLPFETK